ncbi:MAG TPA: zinc-ribbon domain-containing protein [Candidatus Paceibacterota bacterium]|nr:zinc-ribbon domain-containing protein [Candidatus Paceibacterota bacterium]
MIIFGWRTLIKNIGAVFKRMCDHCHNEDYWILTRSTRWFTLFFIPVIPTSSKYFLACPVCKYGFALKGDQIESIKALAEVNQLLVDGKITQAEHQTRINQLNGQTANHVEAKNVDVGSLPEGERLIYCGSCGNKTEKDLKFCGNCGTAVITVK